MKKIIFLHHSTGRCIWIGGTNELAVKLGRKGAVQKYFDVYNSRNNTDYQITGKVFPGKEPYGWKNYPFDYYNIWVRHAGENPYLGEPTLEILTREYDVIVFKHCFPVSRILEEGGLPDIDSEEKRLENYKLQYNALKRKMQSFPDTKFIVWTPAALLRDQTTPEQAERTNEFYKWMISEWNEEGDNIFIWDFYKYETEGSIYLQDKYASGPGDSHPNKVFSERLAPLFSQFIIDVIESVPGNKKQLSPNENMEFISTP
jgi:hypothetical protein